MYDNIAGAMPYILAPILGTVLGWWGAVLHHDWQNGLMRRKRAPYQVINSIPVDEPVMRRPMEFGPIMQSREQIDRVRDAIVEDQLGARRESPKQRRQRMARYRGWTDRQRVQHWLLHWREDYMADLTGRGWAAI